jgi:hypothetical protein
MQTTTPTNFPTTIKDGKIWRSGKGQPATEFIYLFNLPVPVILESQ